MGWGGPDEAEGPEDVDVVVEGREGRGRDRVLDNLRQGAEFGHQVLGHALSQHALQK